MRRLTCCMQSVTRSIPSKRQNHLYHIFLIFLQYLQKKTKCPSMNVVQKSNLHEILWRHKASLWEGIFCTYYFGGNIEHRADLAVVLLLWQHTVYIVMPYLAGGLLKWRSIRFQAKGQKNVTNIIPWPLCRSWSITDSPFLVLMVIWCDR